MGGRVLGRGLMPAAVAVQTGGTFLPWVRTGLRDRNGFELVDAARALDVLDSGLQRSLALAMYLVPLAAALCWLSCLLDRRRTAAVLALGVGLVGGLAAGSIELLTDAARVGARVTLLAAVACVAGGAIELVKGGHHDRTHRARLEPAGRV